MEGGGTMLDLNPVYNYYSTAYAPQKQTKYDSHKRSELKSVYNNMVKNNTKSPLFKIKMNDSTQEYALGVKSAAIGLKNFSEFLADKEENAFSKLTAVSKDWDALSASVITNDYDSLPKSLQFRVDQLAKPQVNEGTTVNSNDLDISQGNHSFIIRTKGRSYSFNLAVKDKDTNLLVQSRVANFINQASIGIDAYVKKEGNHSQLILESDDTGSQDTNNRAIFTIQDDYNDTKGLVHEYQLDNISQYPSDALFTINNMEQTSSSNNIAINKMVEIELKKTTSSPVTVSFVPDTQDIVNKMKEFADTYNHIISIGQEHSKEQRGAKKLLHELQGITSRHQSVLESVGLNINDEGYMIPDEALLSQSVAKGEVQQLFSDLSGFKEDLEDKTDAISLDPMNYVDKTVVTYPNTKRVFTNPYVPSIYSGMLFNYYI